MNIEPNWTENDCKNSDFDFNLKGIDVDGDGEIDVFTTDLNEDGNDSYLGFIDTSTDTQLISNVDHDRVYLGETYGDPANDAEHWHQQSHPDTCAVVSQEFILDELGEQFGIEFHEQELRQLAYNCGWYTPGGGTPMMDVGKLLEAHGVPVERESAASLADIAQKLAEGEKVIVGVNAETIWHGSSTDPLANYPGIPGQSANHAVQVIGINNDDPNNPTVILNDPGTPNGQALEVPAQQFMNAWQASNRYLVATDLYPTAIG
jgi:hypothetical protein